MFLVKRKREGPEMTAYAINDCLIANYGINEMQAATQTILWAWERIARKNGVKFADSALKACNRRRERAGKISAYKPYGYDAFALRGEG